MPEPRHRDPGPCPSEDELFAYAAGSSSRLPSYEQLLAHLDRCPSCRFLLAEASRSLQATATFSGVESANKINTFAPGDTIVDRYRIQRFLARGGMGEVYVAADTLLEEDVALKTLACTALDDQRAAFRFKAEARLARRVTHPNVCRILEFGMHVHKRGGFVAETVPFLTMEFLQGETLATRITRSGRLPERAALPILQQVIGGLQAIHACGIVHRDLKAENVFLVPVAAGERALVMDFGLARALDGSVVSTWPLTQMMAGTIDTMAPEQIEGRPPEPTMDVYAVGVLLFHMLTGRRPFNNVPVVQRLSAKAPLPSSVVAHLDPRWDAIVGRCLALKPTERFQSLGELKVALSRTLPVPMAGIT
jgi:eukaryotic-like serine/threonine-protein kinase